MVVRRSELGNSVDSRAILVVARTLVGLFATIERRGRVSRIIKEGAEEVSPSKGAAGMLLTQRSEGFRCLACLVWGVCNVREHIDSLSLPRNGVREPRTERRHRSKRL